MAHRINTRISNGPQKEKETDISDLAILLNAGDTFVSPSRDIHRDASTATRQISSLIPFEWSTTCYMFNNTYS